MSIFNHPEDKSIRIKNAVDYLLSKKGFKLISNDILYDSKTKSYYDCSTGQKLNKNLLRKEVNNNG